MTATCTFAEIESRLVLTVTGFDRDILGYFSLRVPDYKSPRSTSPTSSFEFYSVDAEGEILDLQRQGIEATAKEIGSIVDVTLGSSSEFVAAEGQYLQVNMTSDLIAGDQLQLRVPKWNPDSYTPQPVVTNPVNCTIADQPLSCYVVGSRTYDTIWIENAVTTDT